MQTDLFDRMFSEEYLTQYFFSSLKNRNGGGRDLMSPKKWWENNQETLQQISAKCTNGQYRFAPYKEELILKGRYQTPRCISIPTIRDRLVLGVLNKYLQDAFGLKNFAATPNEYVKAIKGCLNTTSDVPIHFLRTDITDFYNSISHQILLNKVKQKNIDDRAFTLIERAIKTPTLSLHQPKTEIGNERGVPQGLAISNILASLYMEDFDAHFLSQKGILLFKRYVDDILILFSENRNFKKQLKQFLWLHKLNLFLSEEKTCCGMSNCDKIEYIGYVFKNKSVSIRLSNVNRHIQRLSHVITSWKRALTDATLRPPYLTNEDEVTIYYTEELNELISGMKYENVLYGWLPYFQEADDMSQYWQMDKILKRLLSHIKGVNYQNIHSFVKSYYDIRQNSGCKYVRNYDSIKDVNERKAFLSSRGKLSSTHYNEEQIDDIYQCYCRNRAKSMERHIGYFN